MPFGDSCINLFCFFVNSARSTGKNTIAKVKPPQEQSTLHRQGRYAPGHTFLSLNNPKKLKKMTEKIKNYFNSAGQFLSDFLGILGSKNHPT